MEMVLSRRHSVARVLSDTVALNSQPHRRTWRGPLGTQLMFEPDESGTRAHVRLCEPGFEIIQAMLSA